MRQNHDTSSVSLFFCVQNSTELCEDNSFLLPWSVHGYFSLSTEGLDTESTTMRTERGEGQLVGAWSPVNLKGLHQGWKQKSIHLLVNLHKNHESTKFFKIHKISLDTNMKQNIQTSNTFFFRRGKRKHTNRTGNRIHKLFMWGVQRLSHSQTSARNGVWSAR